MRHYKSSDSFKRRIADCHGRWLEVLLDIPYQGVRGGIDLFDDNNAIELKSRMTKYSQILACNSNDIDRFEKQQKGKELFWAFLFYEIARDPKKLMYIKNLENFVIKREVWFIEWDWIKQFPISYPEHSGPFRYANKNAFPAKNEFDLFDKKEFQMYVPRNVKLKEKIIKKINSY